MNSRQIQYAITLSKILNISQAAEELNITQPALSKQILALEKELGSVLFDRSRTPLVLTRAGEHFIKEAQELIFRQEQLLRSMDDYKFGGKGRLTIGISPFRAGYFVSDTIKKMQEKYAGLQVVLRETNSAQLHKDALEGKVDFAIVNLPVDETLLDVITLDPEPIVLVVPEHLAKRLPICPKNAEVSLADCRDVPFIALGKNQELRQLFDKMCMLEGMVPNVTVEVVGISTAWNLARSGIGATVLPRRFVEESAFGDDVIVFSIKNSLTVRKPAIVKRKGQYVSEYAEEAIRLLVSNGQNA